MSKITDAQIILNDLGMPSGQTNEMAALTFLALCQISEDRQWLQAERISLGVSKGIMNFVNEVYNKNYAPNTRETFRRQVLHQFVQGGIALYNPDNPSLPVNSPKAHYAITPDALAVAQVFGTPDYFNAVNNFIETVGMLSDRYLKERSIHQIPLTLSDGTQLELSPGDHNKLQAAIVEQFAPRFAGGGTVLYIGDTAKKNLFVDSAGLNSLGIPITRHSKLPDVVIFDKKRNWLFLIEAVTSHGPVSPKRFVELEKMLTDCTVGKIYVTAFPNMSEFKKHSSNIAWETEVWLSDFPDHLIHFNGDRFMGPR